MSGVDMGVGAWMWMIDIVGVAAWALGAQTVGPAVGEGGSRWDASLGDPVPGPQGSVWVAEGNRAGGKLWMD